MGGSTIIPHTLILTEDNTNSNGAKIFGGTLSISADENLGSAFGSDLMDEATLRVTASHSTIRDFLFIEGGSGFFEVDNAQTYTVAGIVSGSGQLRKTGDGVLSLTNSGNDYSGGTFVSAGTLAVWSDDQLVVNNGATLGGTLDVSLVNPFTLSPGLSFEILDVGGSLSGTFDGLAEGGLVGNYGGTNLLITYAGGDGNDVTLLSATPGDFDIDGDVDGGDFLKWQRGELPNPLSASDLSDWESNFGTVAPAIAAAAAVPEPSSVILLVVCGLFAMGSTRRV